MKIFKEFFEWMNTIGFSCYCIVMVILIIMVLAWNTENKTVTKIVEVEAKSEVMKRIMECESASTHIGNDGQVIINVNANKTVDIGIYQINSIWNKQATALGYNLWKEEDNRAFALWLYKNKGTGPWSSSAKCWNI